MNFILREKIFQTIPIPSLQLHPFGRYAQTKVNGQFRNGKLCHHFLHGINAIFLKKRYWKDFIEAGFFFTKPDPNQNHWKTNSTSSNHLAVIWMHSATAKAITVRCQCSQKLKNKGQKKKNEASLIFCIWTVKMPLKMMVRSVLP